MDKKQVASQKDHREKSFIAKRLIIYVILGNFFLATIITYYNLEKSWKDNLKQITARFGQIEKSSSSTIGTSLYTEDTDQTNKQLIGLISLPDIVQAKLYDMDSSKDLAEGKKPPPNYIQVTTKLKKQYWGQTKVKKIDVFYKDPDTDDKSKPEKVGELYVVASLKGAIDNIKKEGLSQLILQFLQIIGTTFLIFFIFKNLVSRHLLKIANFQGQLNLYDLSGATLSLDRKRQDKKDELENVVLSFNRMKDNLKVSHEKLKDDAYKLEERIKKSVKKIIEEKDKASNLLNNMKQAVFSINENLEVIGPVSAYTSAVFGYDIIGKNIMEVLYKNLDPQLEIFSKIKYSLCIIFGRDDLQFLIIEDHLILRTFYHKGSDEKEEPCIFSISYNPLWNHQGRLESLMFIVEDITEKEKLQAKIKQEKKVNDKNISIITEMSHSEIDDLSEFFQIAPRLVKDSIHLAKKAPSDINALTEMFRYIHTLKGYSRAFNFFFLSSMTHIAEGKAAEIKNLAKKGKVISHEEFTSFISKLYELLSEINAHGKLAQKVFKIENELEKNFVRDIQNLTVSFDYLISKNITRKEDLFNDNQPKKIRKKEFAEVQKRDINDEFIALLKRKAYSLKGALKSIGLLEVSEIVDRFEESLTILQDLKNSTLEDFSEKFIGNYVQLKSILRSLYQKSEVNTPYTQNIEDWCDIFKNFFDFSIELNHIFERDDGLIKLERVLSACRELNLHFLGQALSHIFDIIKSGPQKFIENKEKITLQVREVWLYFSLVGRLDYFQLRSLDSDRHFFNEMKTLGSNRATLEETLKDLTSPSLLIKVLKRISSSKQNPNSFFQEAEKYILEKDDSDIYDYFIGPDEQYQPDIKMILSDLKNTSLINNLPEKIRSLAEEKDPVASLLVKFFEENSDYLYLKLTDFSQLLSGYYKNKGNSDGDGLVRKMDAFPVVLRNLRRFKKIVQEGNIKEIRAAAQRLTDIPIVPSLQKYRSMVQDISTKLNKNIDLRIIGREEALDRESLILFQEAFIHILRNSIDHGIENQEERKRKGKKSTGVIEVYCHEPDPHSIEIKIKDDGAGIDPDIIKRKALEKEIFSKEKLDQMSEEDIMNIIFLPSFSQKESVDELSGRGVGMDVVKKNLEKLGGDVKVKSIPGKGTEFLLLIKTSSAA